MRKVTARALGQIGGADAVPALIDALRERGQSVCQAAAEALERIGRPEALTAIKEWRE